MTKIAKNFLTQTRPRRLIKMHIKEYLNLSELWKWSLWSTGCARQDKTRQDKTRQDKTRQDKTRQDKKQSLTDAMSMTSMWLKLFIIKLNKGKFTDVPWQKGAPFFCYNVPRQRKDSLRRY
jgi:hypothetical protein